MKARMNFDARVHRAARNAGFDDTLRNPRVRYDSEGGALWFARQLDYIMSKQFEELYPELTALNNFPVNFEAGEGAATITYSSYAVTGKAKIISDFSKDFPRADIVDKETTVKVKNLGDSYGYTVEEMRRARFANRDLESAKASAANKGIDVSINDIAWAGIPEEELYGIFSPENQVPILNLPAGTSLGVAWKTKTPLEILADIQMMYNHAVALSRGVEHPDTLLLPTATMGELALKPLPNTGVSTLEYIRNNTPYLKEIKEANELDATAFDTNIFSTTSNPMGTGLLYTNSPDKFEIQIPMQTIVYPPQFEKAEVLVLLEAKTAGVTMYYPASALIVPGI